MSKTTKKVRKSFQFDDHIESKLARHARHERKTQTEVLRDYIKTLPDHNEKNES